MNELIIFIFCLSVYCLFVKIVSNILRYLTENDDYEGDSDYYEKWDDHDGT